MKILKLGGDFGGLLLKNKTSEEGGVAFKLVYLKTTLICASFEDIKYIPLCVSF